MKKLIAAGAVLAAGLSTLGIVSPADAVTSDTVVRCPSEFIPALSDTRDTGEVICLEDGLLVRTYDSANPGSSQNKAAEYFEPVSNAFPTSGSLEWTEGTTLPPGQQLVFDYDGIDGNGNDYNILVGEPVYGDNWWLTNGSSADAKAADPSGAENGGNGSEWFGTLAQWSAAMPTARFLAGGFSLGSGVYGQGKVMSITYGTDVYTFTNQVEPPVLPVANVTGSYTFTKPNRAINITMKSNPQPPNTTVGNQLVWRVRVNPQNHPNSNVTQVTFTQGFNETDTFSKAFAYKSGTFVVRLYKNNVQQRSWTVATNKR